jgi:hypothetical protein
MMMKKLAIGLILIIAVLIGLSSCTQSNVHQNTGTDKTMEEEMLNSVMNYIKANHPDAAPFIKEKVSWTQSSSVKRVGYTGITYSGDGWTVTIGHAVTAEVIYEIRAEYDSGKIVWTGTMKDNTITEEGYTTE